MHSKNGWKQFRFQDLVEAGLLHLSDGYRAKNRELGGNGLIFLRAGQVTDSHVSFDGVERFHDGLTEALQSKVGNTGDTVITTKGNSVGRTTFVTADMPRFVYSPHLSFWRSQDHSRLVPRFLRYWSISQEFTDQLDGLKNQTDMAPYLSLRDQRRLRITLPPPRDQQAIARILGALDDKIDLNRQMNATLEGLTRAIFKSWFVDFDPVTAKAAGRQPAHVSSATSALFPNRFTESALGPIPQGWTIASVPESFDVNPARRLPSGVIAPYLDMHSMPTTSAVPDSWIERQCGSGMRFTNGDTLVARITPCLENGKTAFVNFLDEGQIGWGSTEYIVLRSKPPLPLAFSYFLARDDDFRAFAIANMTGSSGRQRVPVNCLSQYLHVIPPNEVAAAFGKVASQSLNQVLQNSIESKSLLAMRDSLLPQLLSGELRLRVAERLVEEVA